MNKKNKKTENNKMNIFEKAIIISAIFLSIFGITFSMKDILFPEFKNNDEISSSPMRIHKEAVIYEVKCDE